MYIGIIVVCVLGGIIGWLISLLEIQKKKLYSEKEVKDLFKKLQYEMAQQIIGNRGKYPIIPLDFFEENKK